MGGIGQVPGPCRPFTQDDRQRFPSTLSMRQTWSAEVVPAHKGVTLNPRLQRVVVDLLEDFPVDQVVDEAVGQVRAEVPAFRTLDTERMRADVAGAMSLAVESVRGGADPDGLEGDALRAIGALRAEEGVDVDAVLAGFRIVARVTIDTMLEIARARGVDSSASLELTRAVWVHCDEAAAALTAGHRAWTESPERHAVSSAQATLRRLVAGTSPTS